MSMETLMLLVMTFIYHTHSDTITCDGGIEHQDCKGKAISCTNENELCTVRCKLDYLNATQYGVCMNTVINCKSGQNCMIICDSGIAGCSHSIINAANATKLDIISKASKSFEEAQIFCPLNHNCHFIAHPTDITNAFYGIIILSKSGFTNNLINFECDNSNCLTNAKINCTSDYSQSCLIDPLNKYQCINGNDCGKTLMPTLQPTVLPTINPTAPTTEPTIKPFMQSRILVCDTWKIKASFILIRYEDTDSKFKNKLKAIVLNAFIETILSDLNVWNVNYCCVVNDMRTSITNLILNDVSINVTFRINNELYLNYFKIYNNMTQFSIKFNNYLVNKLSNDTKTIEKLIVNQPIYILPLQTKSNHENRNDIILTSSLFIVILCCGVSIYTCNKCWKYELTVDESDNNITKTEQIMKRKSETLQRISEKLEPIKLRLHTTMPSGRTANVAAHIQKELEMVEIGTIKEIQSHSPSTSFVRKIKPIQSYIQKHTLSETEPGLMKMSTAQQEIELDKIFEEMMDGSEENNQKMEYSQSESNKSTKM